jgi:hypothetical protein
MEKMMWYKLRVWCPPNGEIGISCLGIDPFLELAYKNDDYAIKVLTSRINPVFGSYEKVICIVEHVKDNQEIYKGTFYSNGTIDYVTYTSAYTPRNEKDHEQPSDTDNLDEKVKRKRDELLFGVFGK